MKIILREDVKHVGATGEIVDVKPGYARNFLLPRKLALQATAPNMKVYERERQKVQAKLAEGKNEAQKFADKLSKVSITASVAVGDEDRVFGSVTSQNIAELLAKSGHEIDKRKILLDEPIKALGVYDIPIKIHSEVEAKVKLWVVKE